MEAIFAFTIRQAKVFTQQQAQQVINKVEEVLGDIRNPKTAAGQVERIQQAVQNCEDELLEMHAENSGARDSQTCLCGKALHRITRRVLRLRVSAERINKIALGVKV